MGLCFSKGFPGDSPKDRKVGIRKRERSEKAIPFADSFSFVEVLTFLHSFSRELIGIGESLRLIGELLQRRWKEGRSPRIAIHVSFLLRLSLGNACLQLSPSDGNFEGS